MPLTMDRLDISIFYHNYSILPYMLSFTKNKTHWKNPVGLSNFTYDTL